MKINKRLTPYNHNTGTVDRIAGIVIHYVGAVGGAKENCDYFAEGDRKASAHYFVDFDGSIWQSVEDKDIAFHCGADKYKHPYLRNANTIGIEMCVRNNGNKAAESRDWYFEDATVKGTIDLTKYLMMKYTITPEDVVRHYDITGKICPNPYMYNHTKHVWNAFKALITERWAESLIDDSIKNSVGSPIESPIKIPIGHPIESSEMKIPLRTNEHMNMENIQTEIVVTDANREELERLYGKIPLEME